MADQTNAGASGRTEAINACIALADDRATCADALCARKGECQYPSDCPYDNPLAANARAELAAILSVIDESQRKMRSANTGRAARLVRAARTIDDSWPESVSHHRIAGALSTIRNIAVEMAHSGAADPEEVPHGEA